MLILRFDSAPACGPAIMGRWHGQRNCLAISIFHQGDDDLNVREVLAVGKLNGLFSTAKIKSLRPITGPMVRFPKVEQRGFALQ